MEWWLITKFVWGTAGLAIAVVMLIAVYRARGTFAWSRSIRKELKALAAEAEAASPQRRDGIRVIQGECSRILRDLSPQLIGVDDLRAYIRSIAACFFPEAKNPELQISLADLIQGVNASLGRFDQILQRPGLQRIQSLNIRTLNGLYQWFEKTLQHPSIKWYARHRVAIRRVNRIRFLLLIDPFSWLFFLSRKAVVLFLFRNLLVDILLYTGKLALNAYDTHHAGVVEEDAAQLEETLAGLSHLQMPSAMEDDPVLLEIRRELAGFSAVMLNNPAWKEWKAAVWKASEHIAGKHFPDSDKPMQEAAIGPLLLRTRSWLNTLGKGKNLTVVRYAYKTRLETLFQAKEVTDLVLTPTIRRVARTAFSTYGWLKWPLVIYRRAKRFTVPRLAMDIGWTVGKKSFLVFLHRKTFDHACRELEWVYRLSAQPETAANHHTSGTLTRDR